MRLHTLAQWLDWLESCHPSDQIELGLERVSRVARVMGLTTLAPDRRCVMVAGTNGKGSCVAALNAMLRSGGLHVGCYTSPHLVDYNERIVVDDRPVSDHCLIQAFERVNRARGEVLLTYFEFGTLVALDVFKHSALDVIILEVGLGGRLDAVNIMEPDVSIITSIDIDHQDWLGSDRQSIAREKAGIFRAGKPALCADPDPPQVIQQICDQLGAPLMLRERDFGITHDTAQGYHWWGQDRSGNPMTETLVQSNLAEGSVAAALQTLQLLDSPAQATDGRCLANVVLPGRYQTLETGRAGSGQVIVDVAHNPAAAGFLAKRLRTNPVQGKTFALLAMMKDKDCRGVIDAMADCIDQWFVTDLADCPRAVTASELVALISQHHDRQVDVYGDINSAYQSACHAMQVYDRLIVFGSFITVSEVMKLAQRDAAHGD